MNLKPCKRNLVVKFFQPKSNLIVAAGSALAPTFDDTQRTRVKVMAVANEVSNLFSVGCFVLLRPQPNLLPISTNEPLFLIDSSVVEGIVLDDKEE